MYENNAQNQASLLCLSELLAGSEKGGVETSLDVSARYGAWWSQVCCSVL